LPLPEVRFADAPRGRPDGCDRPSPSQFRRRAGRCVLIDAPDDLAIGQHVIVLVLPGAGGGREAPARLRVSRDSYTGQAPNDCRQFRLRMQPSSLAPPLGRAFLFAATHLVATATGARVVRICCSMPEKGKPTTRNTGEEGRRPGGAPRALRLIRSWTNTKRDFEVASVTRPPTEAASVHFCSGVL
jgi:hypothetical protein